MPRHRDERATSAVIPRLPSCLRHGLLSDALCDRQAGWRLVRIVLPQPPISTQVQRLQTCNELPFLHGLWESELGSSNVSIRCLPTERSPQPCASQLLFTIGGEHLDHFHSGEIMNDTKSWVPSPTLKKPAEVVQVRRWEQEELKFKSILCSKWKLGQP